MLTEDVKVNLKKKSTWRVINRCISCQSGILLGKKQVNEMQISFCIAVLPWRILLHLHLFYHLQHIIHFKCFPGSKKKTKIFRLK